MKRIDVNISDELNLKFRNEVNKRLGMKKGNITTAVEQAILDWMKK